MAASPSCPVLADRSQTFWSISLKAWLRHGLHGNLNTKSFYFSLSPFMGFIKKVFLSTFYISGSVIHWVLQHSTRLRAAHLNLIFATTEVSTGSCGSPLKKLLTQTGVCLWRESSVREGVSQKEKVELTRWSAEQGYWHRASVHEGTGRQRMYKAFWDLSFFQVVQSTEFKGWGQWKWDKLEER